MDRDNRRAKFDGRLQTGHRVDGFYVDDGIVWYISKEHEFGIEWIVGVNPGANNWPASGQSL